MVAPCVAGGVRLVTAMVTLSIWNSAPWMCTSFPAGPGSLSVTEHSHHKYHVYCSHGSAMKELKDLVDHREPALPLVEKMLADASVNHQLLPSSAESSRVLTRLQVTTRSTLGTIAYHTGGLLIDHGWLRVLGSGHPLLPRNLADWNEGRADGCLLVADDVVGGFFAINGGGLGEDVLLGARYVEVGTVGNWLYGLSKLGFE